MLVLNPKSGRDMEISTTLDDSGFGAPSYPSRRRYDHPAGHGTLGI